MYQATGSSSSCANTAMPRPHRRPVHNAHPAASTAAPMTTNQTAVPYPLIDLLVGAAECARHQDHGHDDERDALERHHDSRLTHGRRRGNDHDGRA